MRLYQALRLPPPEMFDELEPQNDEQGAMARTQRDAWLTAARDGAALALRCGVRINSLAEWSEQHDLEMQAFALAVEGLDGTNEAAAIDTAADAVRMHLEELADALAPARSP